MPRLEFWNQDEFKKWIEGRMDPLRYECYVTSIGEIILVPLVSTRPIMFSYFLAPTMAIANECAVLIEHRGVTVYKVKTFEWREETRV
jgi:hypothetical protein